ncbi:MAG: Ig-like domain-containing protein, partial [Chloroflexota bacterium]
PTDVLFNVDNTVVTQNQNEFTFNPNEGLPSGFTCEFFINSNGVRDGSGNLLANNYTFRFTTSGSAAPVLTNITPADGAENVPINANVQLTWNEPVTTTDNWFEINCAPGGLRVRPGESSVTGSGANRTINPNENFTAGDECSIDLRSGRIRDADDNALFGGSVTYTFTIGAPESADIDNDGVISPADAIFVINRIGLNINANGNRVADVDENGTINEADAAIVINAIGTRFP